MGQIENLTVMFTDIVDYTARTSRQSRAESQTMLRDHDRLLLPLIGHFGGRRIKSIGDSLLATFRSPTDAVRCGMAMQDALAEYNGGRDTGDQIHIRVALNVGEVRVDRRDVFGEAVNVAARVESLTAPDEIYFTEAVYLAMNKAEVPSAVIGVRQLRGIPEPVKLFHVPPHKINRLIPGNEDLSGTPGELPYGGMHRAYRPRASLVSRLAAARVLHLRSYRPDWVGAVSTLVAIPPTRRLAPLLMALFATAGLGIWLQMQPASREIPGGRALTTTQIELSTPAAPAGQSDSVDTQTARKSAARQWLQQGHSAFEQDRRRDAAKAYAQALDLEPSLQHDTLLAKRLAACLSWASDLATPLIRAHPSPAIIAALSERTGGAGELGARRAADLLAALGYSHRIDPVFVAINDLERATPCEAKHDAVKRLRVLRSPRSLPALKNSLGSGVQAWFKTRCFRSDAQAAIAEIEKAHPDAGR